MAERKLPRPIDYGFRALAAFGLFANTACTAVQASETNNLPYSVVRTGDNIFRIYTEDIFPWDQRQNREVALSDFSQQCRITDLEVLGSDGLRIITEEKKFCFSGFDVTLARNKTEYQLPGLKIVQVGRRILRTITEGDSYKIDRGLYEISRRCDVLGNSNEYIVTREESC